MGYLEDLLYSVDKKLNKDETLIVIDTNYLLYAFQSYSYGEKYLEVLLKHKEKIYIPFISFIEFFSNLDQTINKVIGDLKITQEYMENISSEFELLDIDNLKVEIQNKTFMRKIDKVGQFIKEEIQIQIDQYLEETVNEISEKCKEINKDVNIHLKQFSSKQKNIPSVKEYLVTVNKLRKGFDELFEDVLRKAYTQAEINEFIKDMKERYEAKISPGFADAKSKEESMRRFGELSFPKKAGDLILWRDVIEHVTNQAEKKYDKVVIVTDDGKSSRKSDWREETSRVTKRDLKVEFYQKTDLKFDLLFVQEFINAYLEDNNNTKVKMGEEINNFSDKKDTIIFNLLDVENTFQTQNELMYKVFYTIINYFALSSENLENLACLSNWNFSNPSESYNINDKNIIFNRHYQIATFDGKIISLGTTLNLRDKFRYIKQLFDMVNLGYGDMKFENDRIQSEWAYIALKKLVIDEIHVGLEEYEGMSGIPRITSVDFFKDGEIVNNKESDFINNTLINIELSHVDSNKSKCDEINDIIEKLGYSCGGIHIEVDYD